MRVCFYPVGDKNRASSRYRVYNVVEARKEFIIGNSENWRKADALVFQRVTTRANLAAEAKKKGKLIVFDCSDAYFHRHKWKKSWPGVTRMAKIAHVLTTSNEDDAVLMRGLFKKRVYVIPGAQKPSKHRRKHRNTDRPTIVWIGRENRIQATLKPIWPILQRLVQFQLRFRVLLINDTGNTRGLTLPFCEVVAKKWRLDTVYREIAQCDIGICPQEKQADGRFHKDENKAYTYWICGIPCVSLPEQRIGMTI